MLSASAYSFRQKSRLAISLSWVAGYTNVIAFFLCGHVVSHVTGNVTLFGKLAGQVAPGAAYFAFLVVTFLLGAVGSAFMTEGARRRGVTSKYILPMTVEALLLCCLSAVISWLRLGPDAQRYVESDLPLLYLVSGLASFAMGLQNATITRISGADVRTTHLTGVVTDFGLEGVQYLLWAWDKARGGRPDRRSRVFRVSQRHPSLLRLMLLASIFGSFLFGALAGTVIFAHWPAWALLVPVGFLVWIVIVDWRKPIADVRELDLLADPELNAYGPIKSLLPPELGIYRLTHHRRDALHHAPDFQLWVDRLPRHWRVIILAVSPMTHFDVDAVLDLAAAVRKLRAQRKELVVCGVNRPQYKVLNASGFTQALGLENFAPDLDFAIARGMNLVQELTGGGNAGAARALQR